MKEIEGLTNEEERAAAVFRALGNPARVRIIRELAQRKACATSDFVELLPLAQSTVSQHLKVLKGAGLVTIQADGVRNLYRLHGRGLEGLKDYVTTIWEEAEKAHRDEIERQLEERRYG